MAVDIQELHPGGLQPLGDHLQDPPRQDVAEPWVGVAELAEPDGVQGQGTGRLGREGRGRLRPLSEDATTSRTTRPAPRVRMVTRPRAGTVTSMATRPASTTYKTESRSPSRNTVSPAVHSTGVAIAASLSSWSGSRPCVKARSFNKNEFMFVIF